MDEFNLAARFADKEDEAPARKPSRGKLKRLRRGKTGVGMEKPADFDLPEEEEDLPEKDMDLPPEDEKFPDFGPGPEDDLEKDEAFNDLVDRMEGGSASAGRAAARRSKLKGRRPAPRRFEDEDEE